jgi:hypothetical protein
MSNNPFETGLDDNPFSEAETYNPFADNKVKLELRNEDFYNSSSSEKPATLKGSPQARSDPFSSDNSSAFAISLDNDKPKVKISTSDDVDDEKKEDPSYFSLEYYQRFFDVDSTEVMWRVLRSSFPFKLDFIEFVKSKPDLYGPFWITTSLIFFFSVSSNFSTYLRTISSLEPGPWRYNFIVFTIGVALMYIYVFCVPIPFWIYFKFFGDVPVGIIQMWCIYGYAMVIYIPLSFLAACPNHYVQWAMLGIGLIISSAFLLINMFMVLRENMKMAMIVLGLMALGQIIFVMSIQLIFFQFPNNLMPPITLAPLTSAPVTV